MAAAACTALLGVSLVPQLMPTAQLYSADHGELRDLVLPDQTQVRLNADSRLRVRMGWFSRKVELLQGEATFDIARDRRPFEVEVNGLEIRDIGTVFDVARRLKSTRIGVVSGEVEIWSQGADAQRLAQLGEGRVVQVDARSHAVESLDVPLSMLLDWQQRKVSFLDERLDEVAAAFNRHNQVQVRVLDEGAASARLSGSLDAHRIGALQAFLERDPRFLVRREGDTVGRQSLTPTWPWTVRKNSSNPRSPLRWMRALTWEKPLPSHAAAPAAFSLPRTRDAQHALPVDHPRPVSLQRAAGGRGHCRWP